MLGVPGRPPSNARLGYRPRVRPLPPLEILSRPGKLILSDAQRAELLDVYGVIADTVAAEIRAHAVELAGVAGDRAVPA